LTPGLVKAALEHLPEKIEEAGIDALVLDTYRFLEFVPMRLGIPYVQVWYVLHFDGSGSTPLCIYSWPYETTPEALARNVEGLRIFRDFRAVSFEVGKSYATKYGLQIDWNDPGATTSKLAVITQTPKELISQSPTGLPSFTTQAPFTITRDGNRYRFHGKD
jgi:zeaxanthin glucosyltransferase